MRASRSLLTLAPAALSVALSACGGAGQGETRAAAPTASSSDPSPNVRSADTANIAQQATDPRSGDPTATARNANPAPAGSASTGATTPVSPTGASAPTASGPSVGAKRATPSKISARHVLVQWMGSERAPTSVVRSKEQALAVAQEVLKRAQAKEDFARLAVEFSDEPGAGNRGGSLGRFGHGQMVGAFEAAAFKLDVGELSEIVESPFGFHVIQRTE